MADDGTLNVAVGNPLGDDERVMIARAAGCNVAYFIASDEQITAELSKRLLYAKRTASSWEAASPRPKAMLRAQTGESS
jgi:adsorption protein B